MHSGERDRPRLQFDQAKRQRNLAERNVDPADVLDVFESRNASNFRTRAGHTAKHATTPFALCKADCFTLPIP